MNKEKWDEFERRFSGAAETPQLGIQETPRFEERPVVKHMPYRRRQVSISEPTVDVKEQSATINYAKKDPLTPTQRSGFDPNGPHVSKVMRLAQQIENRVQASPDEIPPVPRKFSTSAAEKFGVSLRSVSGTTVVPPLPKTADSSRTTSRTVSGTTLDTERGSISPAKEQAEENDEEDLIDLDAAYGGVDHESENKHAITQTSIETFTKSRQNSNPATPAGYSNEALPSHSTGKARSNSRKQVSYGAGSFGRSQGFEALANLSQQAEQFVRPINRFIPVGPTETQENQVEPSSRKQSIADQSRPQGDTASERETNLGLGISAIGSRPPASTYQRGHGPSDSVSSVLSLGEIAEQLEQRTEELLQKEYGAYIGVRPGAINRQASYNTPEQGGESARRVSGSSAKNAPSMLEIINNLRSQTIDEVDAGYYAELTNNPPSYASAVSHGGSTSKAPSSADYIYLPNNSSDDEYYDEPVHGNDTDVEDSVQRSKQSGISFYQGDPLDCNLGHAEAPAGIPQVTRARTRTMLIDDEEEDDYFHHPTPTRARQPSYAPVPQGSSEIASTVSYGSYQVAQTPGSNTSGRSRGTTSSQYVGVENYFDDYFENGATPRPQETSQELPNLNRPRGQTSVERNNNQYADIPAALRIGSAGQQPRPRGASAAHTAQVGPPLQRSRRDVSEPIPNPRTSFNPNWAFPADQTPLRTGHRRQPAIPEQPIIPKFLSAVPKYPITMEDLKNAPNELTSSSSLFKSTPDYKTHNNHLASPRKRTESFSSLASSIQASNPFTTPIFEPEQQPRGEFIMDENDYPPTLRRRGTFKEDIVPLSRPGSASSNYTSGDGAMADDLAVRMSNSTLNTVTPSESVSNYGAHARDASEYRAQLRDYHATHLEISNLPISLIPHSPNPNASNSGFANPISSTPFTTVGPSPPVTTSTALPIGPNDIVFGPPPPPAPRTRRRRNEATGSSSAAGTSFIPASAATASPPIFGAAPSIPSSGAANTELYHLAGSHRGVRLTPGEVRHLPFGALAGPIKPPPGLTSADIHHAIGTVGYEDIDEKEKEAHRARTLYLLTEAPIEEDVPAQYAKMLGRMRDDDGPSRREREADAAAERAKVGFSARNLYQG